MSRVLARDCADYGVESLAPVIDEILDTFGTPVDGRSVFLKPNLLAPMKPERGVTTHPAYITVLISTLRRRGAREIMVGDNPGMSGYAASVRVARRSGVLEAAGEHFRNISGEGKKFSLQGLDFLVSREILDADLVINLPRLKTHSLTAYTGAIKNMLGMVIGNGKVNIHRTFPHPVNFSKAMADVFAIRPPELSILDGITAMQGNGPNAGSLRKVGKVLASTDPVALDAVGAAMMGLPVEAVAMIGRARELGLGDHESLELDGRADPIPRFKLPMTMNLPRGFIEYVVNGIGCFFASRRIPKVIKKKCTGCKVCVEHCPQDALTMVGKYPKLEKARCISCFCCVELCTENAYKLKIKW
jgi:uncharacterized protein (DUF362 family)/NAD-dependent dihydropyrimidine dehydrogenase PreA subunit